MLEVDVDGQQIETVVATVSGDLSMAVLGHDQEAAQPVFSRYWLHNRGPAPMGFLPVSVAITPTVARCAAGGRFEVSWVAANQYALQPGRRGQPAGPAEGWTTTLPEAPAVLRASGYARFRSWVVVPEGATPGQYAVAAQASPDDAGLAGSGAVGVVEDVVTVFVGDSAAVDESLGFGMPSAADLGRNVQARCGDGRGGPADRARDRGRHHVGRRVARGFDDGHPEPAEPHPVGDPRRAPGASPWGTWDWVANPTRGFTAPAGGTTTVEIEVAPPADTTPGHAWLMAKVMWFGRAQYAETVRLEVRG